LSQALARFSEYLDWVVLVDPDGSHVARLEKALRKAGTEERQGLQDLLPRHAVETPISERDRKRYGEQTARALAVLKAMRETQAATAAVIVAAGGGVAGASGGGGAAAGGGGGGAS